MTLPRRTVAGPLALLVAVAASAACSDPRDQGPPTTERAADSPLVLAGRLEAGPHAVGFRHRVVDLEDDLEGTVDAAPPRPTAIDLYLWYPAAPTDARPLTFSDYYRVQEHEAPDDATVRAWLRADMTEPPALTDAHIDRVLGAPMQARRDAAPAAGAFPLVLWTYRDSIPTMQAVLNEHLASHGLAVAFAWPRDHAPPLPWQGELDDDARLAALETQVAVLEKALDHVAADAVVDAERIGLLAWSYGGESAHRLQKRRPEVRVVVGIDGTILSGWIFRPEGIDQVGTEDLPVPHVLIRNGSPRIGAPASTAPLLFERIRAGGWHVQLTPLSHGNFNLPGGMIPGVLGLEDVSTWAVGGDIARQGYETICRLAHESLSAYLDGREPDLAGAADDFGPGFAEIDRYPPHSSRSDRAAP